MVPRREEAVWVQNALTDRWIRISVKILNESHMVYWKLCIILTMQYKRKLKINNKTQLQQQSKVKTFLQEIEFQLVVTAFCTEDQ